jgi:hypothetical protein
MREVAISDVVFSFVGTRILAIGVAQSYCWESPKPLEFGAAWMNWEKIGWKATHDRELAYGPEQAKYRSDNQQQSQDGNLRWVHVAN